MKDEVKRIYQLARVIYKNHGVGGRFHLVLDDGNIRTRDIVDCMKFALDKEDDYDMKQVYLEIGTLLLSLPWKERFSIANNYPKYADCEELL